VPGYRGSRSPGDPEFDPFWARVQEAGIFVSFHASDSGYDRFVRMWEGGRGEFLGFVHTPFKTCVSVLDRAISDTVAALICHGVFDRFPGVRVACIENGSGWVKFLFERFELAFGQQPKEFQRHPIETFRRHVWVSPFYEEPIDELAELIGVSQVLFGSDHPHPEGLADPLSFLDDLEGIAPADQQRIMSSNLRALLAPAQ
jgi:predicted TIM-barrel fold metal-dependent hydrolase